VNGQRGRRTRRTPSGARAGVLQQPGGLSAGSRRRGAARSRRGGGRGRAAPLAALLLLVIALAAGSFAFWYAQPVSASISAQPEDAVIVACGQSCEGMLQATELEPGAYEVSISRPGFEATTTVLDVTRFGRNDLDVALRPLPQPVAITAEPSQAEIAVKRDGATIVSGTGSVECTPTAGPITIVASLAGFNSIEREVYLDEPLDLHFWLDPEGQLVEGRGTFTCAGAPKGVMVTPDGSEIWTTILDGPPSIEVFSTTTGKRTGEITLGEHGAVEIVFSADGARAWASQMETARVYEIDAASREVVRTLETESAWSKVVALAPDESTLYVANWSGDDVSVIDLSTGALDRRIPVANTPRGLYPTSDGTALYVASFDDGVLERVDLASGEVANVFSGGGALRHIVGDAERGVLYISDMAQDRVWLHDMATGETRTFVETDEKPNTIDLSPDGRVLFVSCRGENNPVSYYIPGPEWGTVLLFDTETAAPLDAVVGGNQCTALDVSDDGETLVFSDFLDARLRLYHVPVYESLAQGGGGRWDAHFADLHK